LVSSLATPRPPAPLPVFPAAEERARRFRERGARAVPGHNRWHAEIPGVAEVITGGSIRLECAGRTGDAEPVLCGPVVVVGAEPGDVIVVDVLGIGRLDGRYPGKGHPGVIGCAPAAPLRQAAERADTDDDEEVLLGRLWPGQDGYARVKAEAVPTASRGREIGGCAIAPLPAGARILLPVHARGARLSVGDLHFPSGGADDCGVAALPGWIDLRINLTKRGIERFQVRGPMLMPDPGAAA
jgi:formamidase